MRSKNQNLGEWEILSNRGYLPDELAAPEPLDELMRHSNIECHGGGQAHTADVCLGCPRYVGATRTDDRRGVNVRCWWPLSSELEPAIATDLRCDSCGSVYEVAAHPAMECVMICRECLEVSSTPIDFSELGVGD